MLRGSTVEPKKVLSEVLAVIRRMERRQRLVRGAVEIVTGAALVALGVLVRDSGVPPIGVAGACFLGGGMIFNAVIRLIRRDARADRAVE